MKIQIIILILLSIIAYGCTDTTITQPISEPKIEKTGNANLTIVANETPPDSAIKQILSKAIVSDRVIDIFAAAGLKKPDISILSEDFLAEVKEIPHKNLVYQLYSKI